MCITFLQVIFADDFLRDALLLIGFGVHGSQSRIVYSILSTIQHFAPRIPCCSLHVLRDVPHDTSFVTPKSRHDVAGNIPCIALCVLLRLPLGFVYSDTHCRVLLHRCAMTLSVEVGLLIRMEKVQ